MLAAGMLSVMLATDAVIQLSGPKATRRSKLAFKSPSASHFVTYRLIAMANIHPIHNAYTIPFLIMEFTKFCSVESVRQLTAWCPY